MKVRDWGREIELKEGCEEAEKDTSRGRSRERRKRNTQIHQGSRRDKGRGMLGKP